MRAVKGWLVKGPAQKGCAHIIRKGGESERRRECVDKHSDPSNYGV